MHRLLSDLRPIFEKDLEDHEIPEVEKQRCLGRIALAHTTVSQVKIEDLHAELIEGDYFLKASDLFYFHFYPFIRFSI